MTLRAEVQEIPLPHASMLAGIYPETHLVDAFAAFLPHDVDRDVATLASFVFAQQAPWVKALMRMRDVIVEPFGIKTAKQLEEAAPSSRIGIFRIYQRKENELLLGEDDRHLDFRLSVLLDESSAGQPKLVISSVVHCHNALGKTYLALIAPFHRRIVPASLARAAKTGWPRRA
jgi:hypothetical protein